MRKNILLYSLLLFSFIRLFSQDSLSLADAIRLGLENNYQIQISGKNLEITKNNNSWGIAGAFPVITAGLNQNNLYINDTSNISSNNLNPNLNLRWTLFNGFNVFITKSKLEFLEDLSEGNTAIIVENTIQGIIMAYYYALLQMENLVVVEEVMKLSRDRYRYILTKKELGSAVTFDVLQAQNNYLSDSSNYLLQQINFQNALRNLNLILAEPVYKDYLLITDFSIEDRDFMLTDLISVMGSNNKTLLNQFINQEILKKDLLLQKTALYPNITLNSGYNYTKSWNNIDPYPSITSDSYNYYANFTLSLTLFNGYRIRKGIQNAKIQEKIGELQIREMQHRLSNQVTTTYELYNVRKQLKKVADEIIKSAQLNLQISEEKFKSGSINSFNFRDVQLIYLNTALGQLRAIYNLIESQTDLLRLTGGIIAEY